MLNSLRPFSSQVKPCTNRFAEQFAKSNPKPVLPKEGDAGPYFYLGSFQRAVLTQFFPRAEQRSSDRRELPFHPPKGLVKIVLEYYALFLAYWFSWTACWNSAKSKAKEHSLGVFINQSLTLSCVRTSDKSIRLGDRLSDCHQQIVLPGHDQKNDRQGSDMQGEYESHITSRNRNSGARRDQRSRGFHSPDKNQTSSGRVVSTYSGIRPPILQIRLISEFQTYFQDELLEYLLFAMVEFNIDLFPKLSQSPKLLIACKPIEKKSLRISSSRSCWTRFLFALAVAAKGSGFWASLRVEPNLISQIKTAQKMTEKSGQLFRIFDQQGLPSFALKTMAFFDEDVPLNKLIIETRSQATLLVEWNEARCTDTRPPMLVESDYDSWKIRIHRYIRANDQWQAICEIIRMEPTNLTSMIKILLLLESAAVPCTNERNLITDSQGSGGLFKKRRKICLNENETIRAIGNESIHDYFVSVFYKLVRYMKITQLNIPTLMNTKFVNNLPAYWGKYVTNVKQNMDISTTPYVQIYTHLKAYEPHAKKTLKKQEQSTSIVDPLAYVAHTTSAPALSSPSTPSPQPTAQSPNDALMATMTQIANLLSGFQKQFPPTNNQLRTSSNSRTHATVHDGHIGAGKIKKGAAGRKAGGPRKKSVTRSVKAGLQFPVGR
ncbi:reverse transcriptase domain-containing protein, partial [Tanacetum coccineum]